MTYWKNWKTISNTQDYDTDSESPILKFDEHHNEVVDITTGLVVSKTESLTLKNNTKNHEIIHYDDLGSSFSKRKY